jgi:hypothetical protein
MPVPQEVTTVSDVPGRALLDAAFTVLIDRAGGEVELTQSEYHAIKARRGKYVIVGEVDKSGPGESIIRVRLKPADKPDERSPVM